MKEMLEKVIVTVKKYYITIILFMVASSELMLVIYNDHFGNYVDTFETKYIMTFIYGAVLALVINHVIDVLDKVKYKKLLYLILPLLMLFVYFVILGDLSSFSNAFKYLIVMTLTALPLFVIPFIGKDSDSEHYSFSALVSLLVTMLCYFMVTFGLMFIVNSTSALFELNVEQYVYPMLAIFILGFIMPTLFLTLIPSYDVKKEYPNFINKIITYIVFPILSIYTVILYLYFIKILITFNWPSNSLGNLTAFYLPLSIVVLYFVNKLKHLSKWAHKFISIFPYSLIIPNIMMFITFMIRINEYGFTPSRYFGILIFIFVMISIYLLVKTSKVKYIPLTLAILLTVSLIGPLSAFNISKMSQKNRLETILIKNEMLKDNKIVRNTKLGIADKNNIINILDYFSSYHSFDDLEYLPDDFNYSMMDLVFGFSTKEI